LLKILLLSIAVNPVIQVEQFFFEIPLVKKRVLKTQLSTQRKALESIVISKYSFFINRLVILFVSRGNQYLQMKIKYVMKERLSKKTVRTLKKSLRYCTSTNNMLLLCVGERG